MAELRFEPSGGKAAELSGIGRIRGENLCEKGKEACWTLL